MARKKKEERIILEDIELKPQVIGYTYQKKSNIGRVIFIFVAFLLAVYFINDISVFVNKLLGRESAETIESLAGNSNKGNNGNKDNTTNEITYNIFNSSLVITEGNMTLNNFSFTSNILSFDVSNNSNSSIDLSAKKYFIEIYNEKETLLERFKLDVNTINSNAKVSYQFDVQSSSFYYIVLEEKSVTDYPVISLSADSNGISKLTCTKDFEKIIYTFKDDELDTINHTISDSNVTDTDYYTRYNAYQNKITSLNSVSGIIATFNGTLNGYTAIINIDLKNANLSTVEEKYYYGYKELPKVVWFEMQTYGFMCN